MSVNRLLAVQYYITSIIIRPVVSYHDDDVITQLTCGACGI